ncbi:hypothetical protein C8F04DRAFT_127710 [Mycena alexandri]|uniref:Uncharacterized protein n=1 Tax=Mycena alexandri TaxID=1745969 RepID=A0AAD6WYG5_9AGAR|nr:hypothetical protein C8F04DRAFT_127710 [Mycena alexandri]
MNPAAHTPHNVLCPQLRSVEFTNFTGFSDDMVLEFIRARTESQFAGVARLQKFHADFNRPKLLDVTTALQQAVADGLDLILRYFDDRVKYSPAQDNDIRLPSWGATFRWLAESVVVRALVFGMRDAKVQIIPHHAVVFYTWISGVPPTPKLLLIGSCQITIHFRSKAE